MRARFLLAALTAAGLFAAPARADSPPRSQPAPPLVYPGHWGGPFGLWYGGWQPPLVVNIPAPAAVPAEPAWQGGADREGWPRECRRRLGDNGLGGAVIGGVIGGVAGHELAGRDNRVVGTVAGAAVGALAGSAIDKAEDAGRARDRCEAMLAAPPAPYGYGYGYGVPVMLVPVVLVPPPQTAAPLTETRPRTETVVTEEVYETVPRRTRHVPRRSAPDKRVPQ